MSFPLIRPDDVKAMSDVERLVRLEWLRSETAEATRRHSEILLARRLRERAEVQPAGEPAVLGVDPEVDPEQAEADLVLGRRRQQVALGLMKGDGGRGDDLRAAHAAVKAGSVNPVLQAMSREYNTWRQQLRRAAADSYVTRRATARASAAGAQISERTPA